MIHTIVIFVCTVINSAWGFFWIRQLNKQYEEDPDGETDIGYFDVNGLKKWRKDNGIS